MITISRLWVYPIKSCAGIELQASKLTVDGLAWDRRWMLVDHKGKFLTQRQLPRMALITAKLSESSLWVSAPAQSDLEVSLDHDGQRVTATLWGDRCDAVDVGDLAAGWFSEALAMPCRLVAFNEQAKRNCDPEFVGTSGASTQFSDGFPLLVIGEASLRALNERLVEKGLEPVSMAHFRPNLALHGLDAFDEDHIRVLCGEHDVALRLVKPCARCLITTVDPTRGVRDASGEPLATLNQFRADREFGTVLGQNAIVLGGAGKQLTVGDELQVDCDF